MQKETMISTAGIDNFTLNVTQEIRVRANLEATFAALLEQLGPANDTPDGRLMPMKIEPWPGGRWFRDLGENNGHFWGHVQAIKRPSLLEITGPLFMSYPVVSNVQYRLTEESGVNPHQVSSLSARSCSGRPQRRCSERLDAYPRWCASAGRRLAVRTKPALVDEENPMCPACMASAALMAGGAITTGGLSALVGKILRTRKSPRTNRSENTPQRRNEHGYVDEQDESRATS